MKIKSYSHQNIFEKTAQKATYFSRTTMAFIIAASVIITWLITGPLFHFSDTWQLVINTGTTIITFLMVFLIQRTQNKDSRINQLALMNQRSSFYLPVI